MFGLSGGLCRCVLIRGVYTEIVRLAGDVSSTDLACMRGTARRT